MPYFTTINAKRSSNLSLDARFEFFGNSLLAARGVYQSFLTLV